MTGCSEDAATDALCTACAVLADTSSQPSSGLSTLGRAWTGLGRAGRTELLDEPQAGLLEGAVQRVHRAVDAARQVLQ